MVNLQNGACSRPGFTGAGFVTGVENLVGSLYDDVLTGDSNANRINGSVGNDRITGGQGGDTLTGGAGADTFVYTSYTDSSPAFDAITDFNSAAGDRIDLSAIDADTATAGDQAFTFIGGAAFGPDATGQLRYANGVLYGSNDADATAEFAIVLSGTPAVSAGDFLL
jgi:Ca2+-binding RTX toxin-like protein